MAGDVLKFIKMANHHNGQGSLFKKSVYGNDEKLGLDYEVTCDELSTALIDMLSGGNGRAHFPQLMLRTQT